MLEKKEISITAQKPEHIARHYREILDMGFPVQYTKGSAVVSLMLPAVELEDERNLHIARVYGMQCAINREGIRDREQLQREARANLKKYTKGVLA